MNIRSVAIDQAVDNRFLDHLAPICAIMDMTLIVSEEKKLELIKHYYPQIEAKYCAYSDFSSDFLARNYDLFFHSVVNRDDVIDFFAKLYDKKATFVYCPHGNSDKPLPVIKQDIVLAYGDQMKKKLKHKRVITIGNYRYLFYKQHKSFYDEIVEKEVFSRLNPKNKTIIYAPTWNDDSFFTFAEEMANLKYYNLIVKLHPLLEELCPSRFFRALSFFENKENIVILNDYPLVYPILARSDIYIGDSSSIGYDFLTFQRPIFFFYASRSMRSVGAVLPKKDIYHFIREKSSIGFIEEQKTLYNFTFGEENFCLQIKQQLREEYENFGDITKFKR